MKEYFLFLLLLIGCTQKSPDLKSFFQSPPESAKPWVFWYWMYNAYSKKGITADLEAMKEAGIGGAYLTTIKGVTDPPLYEPVTEQLTPEFWEMITFAFQEAERLGLKLGMLPSDGFAIAGGPWITPEMSMQKVVWTETFIKGEQKFNDTIIRPESCEGYYKDIAVYAYPTIEGAKLSTRTIKPKITTNVPDVTDASFLIVPGNTQRIKTYDPCWIQYEFKKPFICRSITISTYGNNYQSHRLALSVSDDGKNFTPVKQLEAPRHGWQDTDADVTHVIPETTAKHFRFSWTSEGSEPGAEDLDAAKWPPRLKLARLELSGAPRIHQYEGKTGEVWRISKHTTEEQVPQELCIHIDEIVDITEYLDTNGRLIWDVPEGNWTILRMGHTSNGHTNYTGGAGLGLECDKFSPEAVKFQFNKWFGEAIQQVGPELASRVLTLFHVDSWECGSQNWSVNFPEEFNKRRGYDMKIYLPIMAGIPVEDIQTSEAFLFDVRQTIAELMVDVFYKTLDDLAHQHGCEFTGECVAPTMTSDGMLHYKYTDIPMGEFWLNSPTHDKPNDMLDAISGAHIYGKNIIQAEGFTTLRMDWSEHPGNMKVLGDRNYALGINRMVYHVCTHNPWLDRKPGMTLDGVGLYYQRDQTWWKPGRAWVEYAQRCQALLQQGKPVVDIAIFTGEETPRRAVLADRLIKILPGIFGAEIIEQEKQRLANKGVPQRVIPDGVKHSANMADPEKWIDPLNGYQFDSYNKDALLRLAKVEDGKIVLPGGASYDILIIPGARRMSPEEGMMSLEVAEKIMELVKEGATIIIEDKPYRSPGLANKDKIQEHLRLFNNELWPEENDIYLGIRMRNVEKGRVILGPYKESSFDILGIERDLMHADMEGEQLNNIAWTHRKAEDFDIYFISNQLNEKREISISLRETGRIPEIYDPVTGEVRDAGKWEIQDGRTVLPLQLTPNGSLFIVLQKKTRSKGDRKGNNWKYYSDVQHINNTWEVKFDTAFGGPAEVISTDSLWDWTIHKHTGIKYYSGTAKYKATFFWTDKKDNKARKWLNLGDVCNIAEVWLNDIPCGVAWTPPYQVEITDAIKQGENKLYIEVSNTWVNRLIGDQLIPEEERITWTTAPYRLEGKYLLESGLLGPIHIMKNITNSRE